MVTLRTPAGTTNEPAVHAVSYTAAELNAGKTSGDGSGVAGVRVGVGLGGTDPVDDPVRLGEREVLGVGPGRQPAE